VRRQSGGGVVPGHCSPQRNAIEQIHLYGDGAHALEQRARVGAAADGGYGMARSNQQWNEARVSDAGRPSEKYVYVGSLRCERQHGGAGPRHSDDCQPALRLP
jgi:hypothetical protein